MRLWGQESVEGGCRGGSGVVPLKALQAVCMHAACAVFCPGEIEGDSVGHGRPQQARPRQRQLMADHLRTCPQLLLL